MSTEYVLHKRHGYGISPRRPMLALRKEEGEDLMSQFAQMFALEAEYAAQ